MSLPLELLALEPEKNRLIFHLNHNSNLKELKKRLLFCSTNPIKNKNLIVTSVSVIKKKEKKRIVEKKKNNSFFNDYIPSVCFDDFFYNTNFYSTFPELILLRTNSISNILVDFFQSPYFLISFEIV